MARSSTTSEYPSETNDSLSSNYRGSLSIFEGPWCAYHSKHRSPAHTIGTIIIRWCDPIIMHPLPQEDSLSDGRDSRNQLTWPTANPTSKQVRPRRADPPTCRNNITIFPPNKQFSGTETIRTIFSTTDAHTVNFISYRVNGCNTYTISSEMAPSYYTKTI